MLNLLRMNNRRIFRSKMFAIAFLVILVTSIASAPVERALMKAVVGFAVSVETESKSSESESENTAALGDALGNTEAAKVSEIIADPFVITFLPLFILLLVVSFSYMDIENGFIKNIAGQQPKRSRVAVSKYLTIMLSNLVLMLTALIGQVISKYIVGKVEIDAGAIPQAVYTFGVRWLLLLALSALLLFLTVGIGAKPLALVTAVLAGTGFLGLIYLGIDTAIQNMLHIQNLSLVDYAPDQLLTQSGYEGPRAVIVGITFSVVFMLLTVLRADKTDVK
ncbi:MAG: hypothetical protein IKI12_11835 [Lachnospiraceae bacterium]|nr:hypothetical protein [Lachnospiraceae bacterium]MBR7017114.1 hypothetical protein [Lachnospiraceae bacterium]